MLVPVFFAIVIFPIAHIVASYGLEQQQHADTHNDMLLFQVSIVIQLCRDWWNA